MLLQLPAGSTPATAITLVGEKKRRLYCTDRLQKKRGYYMTDNKECQEQKPQEKKREPHPVFNSIFEVIKGEPQRKATRGEQK